MPDSTTRADSFRRAPTIVSATEAELSFYGEVTRFELVDVPMVPLS